MKLQSCLAILVASVAAYTIGAQGRNDAKVEVSPHATALELVFQTQQKRIREADAENWWHDTKERTWVAKRPFAPGNVNSTQMFEVSFRIEGKEVAAWLVDTAHKDVQVVNVRGKKS